MERVCILQFSSPLIHLTGREKQCHTHCGGGGGRLTSFSFLKYPLRLVPLRFPGLFVLIGLGNEISDTLIYRLWSWSLGAKNSHPVPSELRHDCFLQVGGFLFSSVHISVGSLEHHYLLSVYLFPVPALGRLGVSGDGAPPLIS